MDIIQIYKSKEIFTKSAYTPENRKAFHAMEPSYNSTQGFLEKETLVLPLAYKNHSEIEAADLIIIQDIKGWESFLAKKEIETLPGWFTMSTRDFIIADNKILFPLRHLDTPKSFDIFRIRKQEDGFYELFIDYDAHSLRIGIPERENHKICNLKPGKPVRYQINGKSDFTMTGRKERTFYEFDFMIEWIGKGSNLEFRELNRMQHKKSIPLDQYKLIDERKILL